MTRKERVQAAFGKALRKFRLSGGLSQEKLAELADIHRNYVGDIERGERNIGIVNMVKVADALKVNLSEVVREMEKTVGKKPPTA